MTIDSAKRDAAKEAGLRAANREEILTLRIKELEAALDRLKEEREQSISRVREVAFRHTKEIMESLREEGKRGS